MPSNAARLSDFGSGIGTFGAVLKVDNTNQRIGIGTTNPAYKLDVYGAINSTVDVKINGVSVADTALNDAVAMAIALG